MCLSRKGCTSEVMGIQWFRGTLVLRWGEKSQMSFRPGVVWRLANNLERSMCRPARYLLESRGCKSAKSVGETRGFANKQRGVSKCLSHRV